ncbi:MAG: hypothetical protein GQE15_29050 [Archangiaceae bacterium]|nr:hypothetical protein [Archangiaceae bacterium]
MRASALLLLFVACAKPATENERCTRTSDCVSGLACCGGACIDLQKDTRHCGACDAACPSQNALAACVGGACRLSCNDGFSDCNAASADGCEVNTTNDSRHCGACGAACSLPNASSTCSASQCSVSACNTGYANCDGRAANGCEVVSASDLQNCGGCGAVCTVANGTPRCTTGQCFVATCAAGRADCDGLASTGCEVDTKTSAMHCNGCGQACAADQACADGTCRVLELFVFGGLPDPTGVATNEVKRLQLGQRLFTALTPLTPDGTPSARAFQASAWDAMESRMLVFGGTNVVGSPALPQVWSLTLGAMPTWNLLATTGTAPSAVVGQASGWDRTRRRWFLFGGTSQLTSTTRSAELFVFDATTATWSQPNVTGTAPPARAFAAATYDDATSRFIVHGGRGVSGTLPDTWVFDPTTSTWTQVLMSGPAPREFATFFSGSSPPLLVGGLDATTHFDDLWELDVLAPAWTSRTATNRPPARRSAVGLTVGGVRTLVSGVFDDGQTQTLFNDVWTLQWPALTWQQVRSNSLSGASDQRVGFSVVSTEPR